MKRVVVRQEELPLVLELRGKCGAKKLYQMVPARKALGACLNVIDESIERALVGRSDQQ